MSLLSRLDKRMRIDWFLARGEVERSSPLLVEIVLEVFAKTAQEVLKSGKLPRDRTLQVRGMCRFPEPSLRLSSAIFSAVDRAAESFCRLHGEMNISVKNRVVMRKDEPMEVTMSFQRQQAPVSSSRTLGP